MGQAKARAWGFPTSPRSVHVFQETLALIKQIDGLHWNTKTQETFTRIWADHNGESFSKYKNPAWSARDRITRAPKLLGCIYLPPARKRGHIRFTEAGNALLLAEDPSFLFQRQLAKVQYSSPFHNSRGYERMRVRPMLLVAELLKRVGFLSKEELAIFALTTIDADLVDRTAEAILAFREALSQVTPGKPRTEFRRDYARNQLRAIYDEDIAAGNIKIREGNREASLNAFLKTKRNNLDDHADATIRYLLATDLFTINPQSQKLELTKINLADTEHLLEQLTSRPIDHKSLSYDEYVLDYLGNAHSPQLRKDDPIRQRQDVIHLVNQVPLSDASAATAMRAQYDATEDPNVRLDLVLRLSRLVGESKLSEQAGMLKDSRTDMLPAIAEMFNRIAAKSDDVTDKPLMYEWNTWRTFVLINDAIQVKGNFSIDVDGNPVSTASGKQADIIVEYEDFWLLVEVTLSNGHKQYEMEGESIVRHVGLWQRDRHEAGDRRPVYGIFVAERVNETVIQHLHVQSHIPSQHYKGAVRILPLKRVSLVALARQFAQGNSLSSRSLLQFIQQAYECTAYTEGELSWSQHLEKAVKVPLSSPTKAL